MKLVAGRPTSGSNNSVGIFSLLVDVSQQREKLLKILNKVGGSLGVNEKNTIKQKNFSDAQTYPENPQLKPNPLYLHLNQCDVIT